MKYQHQIIRNHPQEKIWKFDSNVPYIPSEGDKIVFPEKWKHGEFYKVTNIEHYIIDKLVVIRVNPLIIESQRHLTKQSSGREKVDLLSSEDHWWLGRA